MCTYPAADARAEGHLRGVCWTKFRHVLNGQYLLVAPRRQILIPIVSAHNLLGVSLGGMGLSFICFGVIEHINSSIAVLLMVCILRVVQGVAGATQYTTALCLIAKHAKGSEKPK